MTIYHPRCVICQTIVDYRDVIQGEHICESCHETLIEFRDIRGLKDLTPNQFGEMLAEGEI